MNLLPPAVPAAGAGLLFNLSRQLGAPPTLPAVVAALPLYVLPLDAYLSNELGGSVLLGGTGAFAVVTVEAAKLSMALCCFLPKKDHEDELVVAVAVAGAVVVAVAELVAGVTGFGGAELVVPRNLSIALTGWGGCDGSFFPASFFLLGEVGQHPMYTKQRLT